MPGQRISPLVGLAVDGGCHRIVVTDTGIVIDAEERDRGTTFTIVLPSGGPAANR